MPRRAVIFDLDDTLIHESSVACASLRIALGLLPGVDVDAAFPSVREEAQRIWRSGEFHPLCRALGISWSEGLWSTFEGNHPSLDGLAAWAPEYRRLTWANVVSRLDAADESLAAELSEAYVSAQRAGHRLIEGASDVVGALHQEYRLGLLTNGPSDIQRHKLSGTGLGHHFSAVVISGETCVGKPAEGAFARVLDALEIAAEDAVMVGDSWERDVLGALGVGVAPIWIAGGRPPPDVDAPVSVIERIVDLPDSLT
jgi:putative hydrolase of the HAD superfamily